MVARPEIRDGRTTKVPYRDHTVDGVRALQHQNGIFYQFDPGASAYYERDEPSVRAALYHFLESAKTWADEILKAFKPTKSKVEGVIDALRAVCNLPTTHMAPCWLQNNPGLVPVDVLPCRNGLLHAPTRQLYPATPNFFALNGLDFDYDAQAPQPVAWTQFLESVWPDDRESIDTLQEFFGYYLTPDTRFQKIGMMVGPKRSGKGTIARVLRRVVGARNVCSPTLAAFGRDFGKQVLIGKSLAVISDARISGRTDTAVVAETLLSISGEDPQTVERKFLPDWNGWLAVRFILLANELPRITGISDGQTLGPSARCKLGRHPSFHPYRDVMAVLVLSLFPRTVNNAPRDRQLPEAVSTCTKCQRVTVVKAVLQVGQIVYLRCEECASAWPVPERRRTERTHPQSAA